MTRRNSGAGDEQAPKDPACGVTHALPPGGISATPSSTEGREDLDLIGAERSGDPLRGGGLEILEPLALGGIHQCAWHFQPAVACLGKFPVELKPCSTVHQT